MDGVGGWNMVDDTLKVCNSYILQFLKNPQYISYNEGIIGTIQIYISRTPKHYNSLQLLNAFKTVFSC